MTHNERRVRFRLLNHVFRIVPGFMGKSRIYIAGDRRQNLKPKLAQVPEQSKFTHGAQLVVAGHG